MWLSATIHVQYSSRLCNLKLRNTIQVYIQIRDEDFPMVKTMFLCLVTAAVFSSTKSLIRLESFNGQVT